MKKIIALVLLVTTYSFCNAQNEKLKEKDIRLMSKTKDLGFTHFKDSLIDKVVGKWKGDSGNESLELIFNKLQHNIGSDSKPIIIDILNGGYVLSRNGIVVINKLNQKPIYNDYSDDKYKLYVVIYDMQKKFKDNFSIIFIDENTIKIDRISKKSEGYKSNPNLLFPTSIVLKRL